jgi:2-polyprenyl-6-hydroxyphenyl methylase / 3-demethylubiquinone-9 3-methyltransferase
MTMPKTVPSPSIDAAEIARFERLAAEWWDPNGKMKPLHRFNPTRVSYLRELAVDHFKRVDSDQPLAGLSLVDIGCGGGLLSEPMAKAGARVTGLDPGQANIAAAALHAAQSGLLIDYRAQSVEALAETGARFDIVLAMEVVEHVADVEAFVQACCHIVRPGGLLVMATLNRTLKSFALAIIGAEYILRWLPKGTHQWEKFITPAELETFIKKHGLRVIDKRGTVYHPLADRWRLSGDMDVNYMLAAMRASSS